MNKDLTFLDCTIKTCESDDFETKLDTLIADENATLDDIFNCVKNRIKEVSDFTADKPYAKIRISGILWYLKQLLPLTYRTTYKENGKDIFCVWNMWFGVCFNIESYEIKKDNA